MNKSLLHSVALLALALVAGKGELLMAQSGDIKAGDIKRSGTALLGLHHGLALANSPADSRQPPEPHPDPVAEGMAKTKAYEFRSIDYPGGGTSAVYDFNGKTAVGEFFSPETAFAFQGSSYVPLNVPGAMTSAGTGINTSGEIVGWYKDSSGNAHGFLYDGSRYTTIDDPGSLITYAYDINDAGLIVGYYADSNYFYHGLLYDNGTSTAIDFPGAFSTFAYGINSSGDIVGSYDYAPGGSEHGFLLRNGVYLSLDDPLANETFAQGINDAGTIAGYYYDANFIPHGFTYAGGIFTTVDVTGAQATELWRIKNSGNVVGFLSDRLFEFHGFIGK